MTCRYGNAAWRALSDDCHDERLPRPCTDAEDVPVEEWEALPVSVQQAIASGRYTYAELLERTAVDPAAELCPECACRPVAVASTGLCLVCHRHRLQLAHERTLAELEAQRGVNQAKTQLRRLRDEIDPDRPRSHPAWRECASCGTRLPSKKRHPEDRCAACIERDERREAVTVAQHGDG